MYEYRFSVQTQKRATLQSGEEVTVYMFRKEYYPRDLEGDWQKAVTVEENGERFIYCSNTDEWPVTMNVWNLKDVYKRPVTSGPSLWYMPMGLARGYRPNQPPVGDIAGSLSAQSRRSYTIVPTVTVLNEIQVELIRGDLVTGNDSTVMTVTDVLTLDYNAQECVVPPSTDLQSLRDEIASLKDDCKENAVAEVYIDPDIKVRFDSLEFGEPLDIEDICKQAVINMWAVASNG